MDLSLIESLGVSEKAAAVYMAGLSLGTTTVQELARKSEMKRPTVYLKVDELIKQGLFETVAIDKKTYYRAADPEIVEARLKKNLALLQAELPKLSAMKVDTMGKPKLRILEGERGIRQIYEEAKSANSLRMWSNIGQLYGPFHEAYMELAEAISEREIGAREITADTKESRRYMKLLSKTAGSTYSLRVASNEGIENDTIIYGSVVALFRLSSLNMFVVRIEDKTIADTMRAMFDMAWKSAKPFK